ncbi:hypothetical protein MSG28_001282 [Choristoneura fumiferana]|uniref:Uncharacterized protein n=1 Tax=Choristoneura fumiferana TaxID=7141 RepID=A0ACC0K4F1_CHOFU|nr:hypothetical protein MSG28_001282 [Choristoneura fumiferana]
MQRTRAASGVDPKNLQFQHLPFIYQLMPHLLDDPHSLKPAYHMKGPRQLAEIVVGIPTVKRDKESYLLVTLTVEVLPVSGNYTVVDSFDEFGLADGSLRRDRGPISAIRLRVNRDSTFWVILSEIELKPYDQEDR